MHIYICSPWRAQKYGRAFGSIVARERCTARKANNPDTGKLHSLDVCIIFSHHVYIHITLVSLVDGWVGSYNCSILISATAERAQYFVAVACTWLRFHTHCTRLTAFRLFQQHFKNQYQKPYRNVTHTVKMMQLSTPMQLSLIHISSLLIREQFLNFWNEYYAWYFMHIQKNKLLRLLCFLWC